jgi:hypothetical protein
MSKLAEYMLVLSEDGTEHAGFRRDRAGAMTRFGLSELEQEIVLTGGPGRVQAEILGEKPRPVPITTTPPPPPPPQPPK